MGRASRIEGVRLKLGRGKIGSLRVAEFNAINRGVYIADNIDFLRSLNDECVDLVCIDPPFAKNETFVGDRIRPPLTEHEQSIERRLLAAWGVRSERAARDAGIAWPDTTQAGFRDIWSWEQDIHEDWKNSLDDAYPGVAALIDSAQLIHSDSIAAYLCYMGIRLVELRRVLKPTGSLYLHCDHTANGYLRQLLDGVFGERNLRNEIIWQYRTGGIGQRWFARKHDTIFFYSKTKDYPFTLPREGSRDPRRFNKTDEEGRKYYEKAGNRYYEDEGVAVADVWDIPTVRNVSVEYTGYRTQKPIALAERIIAASSKPGDTVLDCFAGCAYAAIAAERLGRNWVTCDINPRAWTVLKRQFQKPRLQLLQCNDETTGQAVLGNEPVVTVHGPNQLPLRTSPISRPLAAPPKQIERKYKVPASIIPEAEMLRKLLEFSGYQAWCCGFANRRSDGTIIETTRNFHLDHIEPRSKDGSDQITNRAPMCPSHNLRKSNRLIFLQEYRREIEAAGELCVDSLDDLVSLPAAAQFALDEYAAAAGSG